MNEVAIGLSLGELVLGEVEGLGLGELDGKALGFVVGFFLRCMMNGRPQALLDAVPP